MAAPGDERDPGPAWLQAGWGIGDAVFGVFGSITLAVLVGSLVIGLAGLSSYEYEHLALWVAVLLQVPLWSVLVGVPLWASRTKGLGSLRADFGLTGRARDALIGLPVGFASQLALMVLLTPLYRALDISDSEVSRAANDLGNRATDAFGWVCLFVLVVAAAPVIEELFYRGLVLRAIIKRFGAGRGGEQSAQVIGILASGLLFGLVHFDAVTVVALSLFGMVLALLAVRSGRLGPAIWAHVAFNLTTFVSLIRS